MARHKAEHLSACYSAIKCEFPKAGPLDHARSSTIAEVAVRRSRPRACASIVEVAVRPSSQDPPGPGRPVLPDRLEGGVDRHEPAATRWADSSR